MLLIQFFPAVCKRCCKRIVVQVVILCEIFYKHINDIFLLIWLFCRWIKLRIRLIGQCLDSVLHIITTGIQKCSRLRAAGFPLCGFGVFIADISLYAYCLSSSRLYHVLNLTSQHFLQSSCRCQDRMPGHNHWSRHQNNVCSFDVSFYTELIRHAEDLSDRFSAH